jgi:hypothetical protein
VGKVKNKFLGIAIVLLSVFVHSGVIAKENKLNTPPAVAYFDVNAERLAQNYKGHDIAGIYNSIKNKIKLEKSEFETTSDYDDKISSIVIDDIYAFRLADTTKVINGHYSGVQSITYDADNKKMKVVIKTDRDGQWSYKNGRASIIIKEIKGKSESYVGANAFGVKTIVERRSGTQYLIALTNQKKFGVSQFDSVVLEPDRKLAIDIDVPIEKARGLKDNIGVIVLCRPSLFKYEKPLFYKGNDLIFENTYFNGATISSPTTVSFERKFINMEAVAVWVYELNTGIILQKKQLIPNEDIGQQLTAPL